MATYSTSYYFRFEDEQGHQYQTPKFKIDSFSDVVGHGQKGQVIVYRQPTNSASDVRKCPACGHLYRGKVAPKFCPECGRRWGSTPFGKEESVQESIEKLNRIAENDPLGITVEKLTPQLATELFGFPYSLSVNMSLGNLIIRDVAPGSPADRAGLRKNDIFVSVKLPDQGFYSIVMFNSVDDYRKMFNYQVMKNAVIINASGFQFPEGYRYEDSHGIYDYYFRTDIEWNKGANALNSDFSISEIPDGMESDNLADQEKKILNDTLNNISEISFPSFDEIKRDPSKLFELMAAFKKAKQDVTIGALRAIPVKDPDTGQMTTFDQFARKAIGKMDLGSSVSFFQDDPIAATYMMVFDKEFLLEKVPLIKMPNGKYVSLMDATEGSDIAGENSEALRTAIDGLASTYADGERGAVLAAVQEVVSAISQFNEEKDVDPEIGPGLNREKSSNLSEGLIAYYKLDGTSGAVVNDSSGNENDGTVYGATPANDRFGNPDRAFRFDGDDDSIVIPDSNSLNFSDDNRMTLSAWVKLGSYDQPNNKRIIGRWSQSLNEREFYLGLTTDTWLGPANHFVFAVNDDGGPESTEIYSQTHFDISKWYHVVGVYDGSFIRLYVDTEQEASSPYTAGIYNGIENLYIGSDHSPPEAPSYSLDGIIDEVRMYERALSEAEVLALYSQGDNQTRSP